MKSPFPGMDPYLEQHWGDVHATFMVYAKRQLNDQLPPDLQARVEESLAVAADEASTRYVYPDVCVVEESGSVFESESSSAAMAVAEPFEVALPGETPTERHIEIIDAGSGNRVITVIELLSPANKTSEAGRAKYRQKQAEYIQAAANLVEIDLLRSGGFVLAMPEERWPLRHQAPYKVCIRRVQKPDTAAGIGISLREPLPNIPIPLRPTDADVALQLQAIISDCYRDGRYGNIDYSVPPVPPLAAEDAAWAEPLLRERARS